MPKKASDKAVPKRTIQQAIDNTYRDMIDFPIKDPTFKPKPKGFGGPPGMGKSQIPKALQRMCIDAGMTCGIVHVYAANLDKLLIRGMTYVYETTDQSGQTHSRTATSFPDFLQVLVDSLQANDLTWFMVDEWGLGRDIHAALLQFIDTGSIGPHQIDPALLSKMRFLVAYNGPDDYADDYHMSLPTARRISHMRVHVPPLELIDVATAHGWAHPMIISWLKNDCVSTYLPTGELPVSREDDDTPTVSGDPVVNPLTCAGIEHIARMALIMSDQDGHMSDETIKDWIATCQQDVPLASLQSIATHQRILANLVPMDEILANPETARLPDKPMMGFLQMQHLISGIARRQSSDPAYAAKIALYIIRMDNSVRAVANQTYRSIPLTTRETINSDINKNIQQLYGLCSGTQLLSMGVGGESNPDDITAKLMPPIIKKLRDFIGSHGGVSVDPASTSASPPINQQAAQPAPAPQQINQTPVTQTAPPAQPTTPPPAQAIPAAVQPAQPAFVDPNTQPPHPADPVGDGVIDDTNDMFSI